ncbi:HD superfamily phosphohydrolase [Thermoplasmatales archaeon SCGC AB-540-F20]|nr:HD superfamily phosphohydrolase [Thermoplasmatales archaeon SCGC AB-540-F20]
MFNIQMCFLIFPHNELYKLSFVILVKMKSYEVRDPIYGFIKFNEWERRIINKPEFQRLRRIKQLSLTCMVYPGATHTRFEHSLGVMHLASMMFDTIVGQKKNKEILEESIMEYDDTGIKREKQVIRLAALLHDIGHGPFSHTSDELYPLKDKKLNKHYKHEDYSCEIIEKCLRNAIDNDRYNKTNCNIKAEEISGLIGGNSEHLGKRLFWKLLISGQLDADRCDYLLRDSYHTGVKYGVFDHLRLINTMQLDLDPESGDPVIAVHEGGWHIAEAIMIARYKIFTQVYFHKTRRAYDYHLKEAMKHALKGKTYPPPNKIKDFLKFDDVMMWNLFNSNHSNNDCKAIINREHIRSIYSTPETPKPEDEEEKEKIKEKLKEKSFWFHEDKAEAVWYDKDKSDEKIWIVGKNNDKLDLLDDYSTIVNNMKKVKQIRIYVKFNEREKALEVVKNGR